MHNEMLFLNHKTYNQKPLESSDEQCLDPAGGQETAVVLQILIESLQPLLAALQAWLFDGLLQGSPHNFFICEGDCHGHFYVTLVMVTHLVHASCFFCK